MIRAAIFNLAAGLEPIVKAAGAPLNTILAGKDKYCSYAAASPETAVGELGLLLDMFISGLCKPLPFFPESSSAYYRSFRKDGDRKKAQDAAVKKWESDFAGGSESQDDYFKFFYGSKFPCGEEFEETAIAVGDLLQLDKTKVDNSKLEKEGSDA